MQSSFHLVLLVLCAIYCGMCTFNNSGINGSRKDSTTQDIATQADVNNPIEKDFSIVYDSHGEQGMDIEVSAECQSNPQGFVCHFAPDDSIGESGLCVNQNFVRERYCFNDAPCNPQSGLCLPNNGCQSCSDCNGVCTAFVDSLGSLLTCCTGQTKNGSGIGTTACTTGDQCRSGICTGAGNCFENCQQISPDPCPAGSRCGTVVIKVGPVEQTVNGCVLFQPEAGITKDSGVHDSSNPDMNKDSQMTLDHDSSIDNAIPDAELLPRN